MPVYNSTTARNVLAKLKASRESFSKAYDNAMLDVEDNPVTIEIKAAQASSGGGYVPSYGFTTSFHSAMVVPGTEFAVVDHELGKLRILVNYDQRDAVKTLLWLNGVLDEMRRLLDEGLTGHDEAISTLSDELNVLQSAEFSSGEVYISANQLKPLTGKDLEHFILKLQDSTEVIKHLTEEYRATVKSKRTLQELSEITSKQDPVQFVIAESTYKEKE